MDNSCEAYELKKNSNYCKHYTGDLFNQYQLTKCHLYCSYYQAKELMQGEQPLVRVHRRLRSR